MNIEISTKDDSMNFYFTSASLDYPYLISYCGTSSTEIICSRSSNVEKKRSNRDIKKCLTYRENV